jgi:hypothetical protein
MPAWWLWKLYENMLLIMSSVDCVILINCKVMCKCLYFFLSNCNTDMAIQSACIVGASIRMASIKTSQDYIQRSITLCTTALR